MRRDRTRQPEKLPLLGNGCITRNNVRWSYIKIVQRHIEERALLIGNQFGFRTSHSTTLQYMRFTEHVTLNFNNNMSTAAICLDIEKAFDVTWHPGLLINYLNWNFRTVWSSLLALFSRKENSVSVEGEMSTPRKMQAGFPQGSVLSPTLYSVYINHTHRTPGVYLAVFVDDTCTYTTGRKEGYVLRKLQRGLNSVDKWCESWNIKINKIKFGPSTSVIDLDHLRFISHLPDGTSPSWIM
jgi:hypothetical protein